MEQQAMIKTEQQRLQTSAGRGVFPRAKPQLGIGNTIPTAIIRFRKPKHPKINPVSHMTPPGSVSLLRRSVADSMTWRPGWASFQIPGFGK
uniref:Uncharacterized protein n=1 Tax=Vitis vinifera TaxID=29760 RepID=A5BTD5_VITVI|nr:hypothetical protein VITISV_041709 [Vitis vinifera]